MLIVFQGTEFMVLDRAGFESLALAILPPFEAQVPICKMKIIMCPSQGFCQAQMKAGQVRSGLSEADSRLRFLCKWLIKKTPPVRPARERREQDREEEDGWGGLVSGRDLQRVALAGLCRGTLECGLHLRGCLHWRQEGKTFISCICPSGAKSLHGGKKGNLHSQTQWAEQLPPAEHHLPKNRPQGRVSVSTCPLKLEGDAQTGQGRPRRPGWNTYSIQEHNYSSINGLCPFP